MLSYPILSIHLLFLGVIVTSLSCHPITSANFISRQPEFLLSVSQFVSLLHTIGDAMKEKNRRFFSFIASPIVCNKIYPFRRKVWDDSYVPIWVPLL